MARAGRIGGPETLLPEKRKALMDALAVPGCSLELAASQAGVAKRTFFRWVRRGRLATAKASAGKRVTRAERPYGQFWQEMHAAMTAAELDSLALIAGAGQKGTLTRTRTGITASGQVIDETIVEERPGDWRALAWILERRHPKKYARKDSTTTTLRTDPDAPVVFELDTSDGPPVPPPAVQANLAAVAAAGAVTTETDNGD